MLTFPSVGRPPTPPLPHPPGSRLQYSWAYYLVLAPFAPLKVFALHKGANVVIQVSLIARPWVLAAGRCGVPLLRAACSPPAKPAGWDGVLSLRPL